MMLLPLGLKADVSIGRKAHAVQVKAGQLERESVCSCLAAVWLSRLA